MIGDDMRLELTVPTHGADLEGTFDVPAGPRGLVVFALDGWISRRSPRIVTISRTLNEAGLATFVVDLHTEQEAIHHLREFDIPLLAQRLVDATDTVQRHPELRDLPVGYLGTGTGAAAALWAATDLGGRIGAVVSAGGRPDLAEPRLPRVRAPTLLIVGEREAIVAGLNRRAQELLLRCESRLEVIPEATQLPEPSAFEDPDALVHVADLALEWFSDHLLGYGVMRQRAAAL